MRRHAEAGTIEVDDIELAAEHFLAMVEVLPARLADFGLYRSRKEEQRRLLHAVDLFLQRRADPIVPLNFTLGYS